MVIVSFGAYFQVLFFCKTSRILFFFEEKSVWSIYFVYAIALNISMLVKLITKSFLEPGAGWLGSF